MNQYFWKYFFSSILSAFLGLCFAIFAIRSECHICFKFLSEILCVLSLVVGELSTALCAMPISRLHSPMTGAYHFLLNGLNFLRGRFYFGVLVVATKNVKFYQDEILAEILKRNADTAVGQQLKFEAVANRQQFQSTIPLSSYANYTNYVQRIGKGEFNVMTVDPVIKLFMSSGTSGQPKLVPFTDEMIDYYAGEGIFPLTYELMQDFPFHERFAPLKSLDIRYAVKCRYTEGGIPIGYVSTALKPTGISLLCSTPLDLISRMTEPAQTYVHLIFALLDDNLRRIASIFAGPVVVTLEFLKQNWRQLADDIRRGQVTNLYDIPEEIVQKIMQNPNFRANPGRAAKIEAACQLKDFQGVAKRLWPRLTQVSAIMTGAHSVYIDRIRWFVGPNVKLISPHYRSSEGMFAIPMNEQQRSSFTYTLLPRKTFFEFIPEADVFSCNPRVCFMDEVQLNERYELVVTARNGLCRYRMGDIVSIAGFYNKAPIVEFRTRVGGILDVRGEKTTEDMVNTALHETWPKWEGCRQLVDYTATDSFTLEKSIANHELVEQNFGLYYVLFIETEGIERTLNPSEIDDFDNALSAMHESYRSKRRTEMIARPKIFVVRQGTFEELKAKMLENNNTSSNQFKTPRYQKNADLLRFLVSSSYK